MTVELPVWSIPSQSDFEDSLAKFAMASPALLASECWHQPLSLGFPSRLRSFTDSKLFDRQPAVDRECEQVVGSDDGFLRFKPDRDRAGDLSWKTGLGTRAMFDRHVKLDPTGEDHARDRGTADRHFDSLRK